MADVNEQTLPVGLEPATYTEGGHGPLVMLLSVCIVVAFGAGIVIGTCLR